MIDKHILQTVRDWLTEEEWDLIDSALSEYQDHYEGDDEAATYDIPQSILAGLYRLTK